MDNNQESIAQPENVIVGIPCSSTLTSPAVMEEVDTITNASRSAINHPPKSSKVYVVNIQGPGIAKSGGSRLSFNGLNIGTIKPPNVRALAPKPQSSEENDASESKSYFNAAMKNSQLNDELLHQPLPSPPLNESKAKGGVLNPAVYTNHGKKSPSLTDHNGSALKSPEEVNVAIKHLTNTTAEKAQCNISKIFSLNLSTLKNDEATNEKGNRFITFSTIKFGKTYENVPTAKILTPQVINGPVGNNELNTAIGQPLDMEHLEVLEEPFDPILVSQALLAANRKKRPNIIKPKVQKEKLKDNKVPNPIPQYDKKPDLIAMDHTEIKLEKQPLSLDLSKCLKDAVDSFSPKDSPKQTPIDADDVTLVKINGTSDMEKKVTALPDDDVHIEIIPAKSDCMVGVSKAKKSPEIDPLKVLDWDAEGVGILPGCDIKFCMNEFGLMELVDLADGKKKEYKGSVVSDIKLEENSSKGLQEAEIEDGQNMDIKEEFEIPKNSAEDKKEANDVQETIENNDQDKRREVEIKQEVDAFLPDLIDENRPEIKEEDLETDVPPADELKPKEKISEPVPCTQDEIFYCHGCGCYGLASEFITGVACSNSCDDIVKEKEQELSEIRNSSKLKRLKRKQDKSDRPSKFSKQSHVSKKEERTEPSDSAKPTLGWHKINSGTVRLPWQFGSKGFSWPKYLHCHKTRAAPRKLFKSQLPYSKNNFRVGMKMEGIDPEHASIFCVLTVKDVIGYRIKLHFDGYANIYDFWLSADSMDIFPPGWCDKTNRILQPPKGYSQNDFNWTQYLKKTKGSPAAKTLFYNKDVPAVLSGGFRIGMKLEAVDRQNTNLVCVATVADMIGTRILIHFDGWDDVYDYWAEPTSSYIHPVGWCEKYKHPLSPPNNYTGENFSWDRYLKETKSSAAPARAFKPSLGSFRRGMRLECVDKRAPWRVRVATVDDIREHEIRIKFDGWSDLYSYWIDRDSPDIFPMSWCHTTGHFLHIPPVDKDAECPTINCTGQGHALEAEVSKKHSVPDCPYDPENLKIKIEIEDRITSKLSDKIEEDQPMINPIRSISPEVIDPSARRWRLILPAIAPVETSPSPPEEVKISPGRPCKKARLEEGSEVSVVDGDWLPQEEENRERRKKKKAFKQAAIAKRNSMLDQVRTELHNSIMSPGYDPKDEMSPFLWSKHSAPLNTFVQEASLTELRAWDLELVYRFVASIPGCKPYARYFIDNFIDGEALSMITQQDLVEQVGLKLGPAIKLYNSVVLLRERIVNGVN